MQVRKYHVNEDLAKRYYGYANNLIKILEERNPHLWIDKISRTPEDGITINCTITRDLNLKVTNRIIDIIIEEDEGKEEHKKFKCFCNCNFSNGYILKVNPTEDPLITYYTVISCISKNHYKIYINILANDFIAYEEKQHVLLMAYNTFDFDCCNNKSIIGCSPIESQEDVGSSDWRTTYRIVSICPIGIPRWFDEL